MGVYDWIKCNYPLPEKGANKRFYQTKDTPAQYLEHYEIRKDGTLWHREKWHKENFTGEIYFYDEELDFLATLDRGKVIKIERTD